ncbi:MAG: hypothetical protein HZB39_03390 [Planctomycetes bacterium]|nr:hypothetical protein [Planctomycetota bacterium]
MLPDFLALVHGLAGVATPASLRDAASLLLALCSDAAALDATTAPRRALSG